jgi:hypothetical protein
MSLNFGQKMCVGNSTKKVIRNVQCPQLSKFVVKICFLLPSRLLIELRKSPTANFVSAICSPFYIAILDYDLERSKCKQGNLSKRDFENVIFGHTHNLSI